MPPATSDAEAQLKTFIDKFDPPMQRLIRSLRQAMRKRLPTAHEMVWDNYNFFVIGYSPTERPSDAPFSLAFQASGGALCFLYGTTLPDPAGLLRGSGVQVRNIRLPSAATLAEPAVEALIAAAIGQSKAPFAASGKPRLTIRAISAKQRPRRKDMP